MHSMVKREEKIFKGFITIIKWLKSTLPEICMCKEKKTVLKNRSLKRLLNKDKTYFENGSFIDVHTIGFIQLYRKGRKSMLIILTFLLNSLIRTKFMKGKQTKMLLFL